GIDDSASYAKYGNGMDIGDWRRTNVNLLVKELDSRLHEADPDIAFGISPSGIWANKSASQPDGSETGGMEARNALYADSVTWIENGWIDYIIPQIYWEIGKEIADYSILLPWWSGKTAGTDVRLFIGMADYRTRLAKDSPDSVWHGSEELVRQLKLNDTIPEVTGEVHFNYTSVVENEELFDIYSKRYGK
nr:family 10 glycosylhydrolase [Lachnospiraceae bacterium]